MSTRPSVKRGLSIVLMLACMPLFLTACQVAVPASNGEEVTPLTLGETLYRIVVGGPSIGEATLLRFYVWHVVGLAIPMILLMVWHGFRVRRDGGISRLERAPDDPQPETTPREVIVRGEMLTFFLTIASIVLLSVFVDPPIGPATEPGALVEHTKAPWIFLWIQELLRIWPPAIAGVLTPLAVIVLLSLLPYMDWKNDGVAVWFNRQGRIAQIVFIVLFLVILALTVRAAVR